MTAIYEKELNLNEQRMALMSLVDSVQRSIESTQRLRKIRESERAMSLTSLHTKAVALRMAVDRIDALLKASVAEGHYPEALGDQ